ncbi:MAG: hypothetical protein JNG86_07115 [Verrucomicrobiaceae bacterium]|nr:hypothetical protein [Verrucomicrobiaceae bacterium]
MSTVLEIEKAIESLPPKDFWQLIQWVEQKREAAEDAYDNACADAALADGGPTVSWEEVQRQCGLVS